MTWLTEDPAPIIVIGTLTAVLVGAIWYQSQQRFLLYIALAAILLTAGGALIEHLIVTPREEVAITLHLIADEVESNDAPAVLRRIYSDALKQRAGQEMQRYDFEQVKIKRNLEITVFENEDPPRAYAEFNIVAVGKDRSGVYGHGRGAFFLKLTFLREGDAWLISDYDYAPATEGLLRRD